MIFALLFQTTLQATEVVDWIPQGTKLSHQSFTLLQGQLPTSPVFSQLFSVSGYSRTESYGSSTHVFTANRELKIFGRDTRNLSSGDIKTHRRIMEDKCMESFWIPKRALSSLISRKLNIPLRTFLSWNHYSLESKGVEKRVLYEQLKVEEVDRFRPLASGKNEGTLSHLLDAVLSRRFSAGGPEIYRDLCSAYPEFDGFYGYQHPGEIIICKPWEVLTIVATVDNRTIEEKQIDEKYKKEIHAVREHIT